MTALPKFELIHNVSKFASEMLYSISHYHLAENIWASAATPRPTTWPRTRKENARFKKANTRNQQGVVRPLGERVKPRDQHGTRCDSTLMSQILTVQQEVARDIRAKDRQESKANPSSYRYGSTWLLQNVSSSVVKS